MSIKVTVDLDTEQARDESGKIVDDLICEKVVMVYEYRGKKYTTTNKSYDGPLDGTIFFHTDGNMGCDCNISLDIARQCNPKFPEFECGTEIDIVGMTIYGRLKDE